jgi:hypothetical protein
LLVTTHTNENTQVSGYHVQGGDVVNMAHDAADTGENSSETDYGVQCSNGLGQIGRRDALANEESFSE